MIQCSFVFQADRCVACHACVIACLNENRQSTYKSYRRIVNVQGKHNLSLSCNHCDSPECFRVCPKNAFTKRRDGIVELDKTLCNGCGLCVPACPYEALQYDAVSKKVDKCNFCSERQSVGDIPACVEACTTSALIFKNSNADRSFMAKTVDTIEGFYSPLLTRPLIRFIPVEKKKRYWIMDENE